MIHLPYKNPRSPMDILIGIMRTSYQRGMYSKDSTTRLSVKAAWLATAVIWQAIRVKPKYHREIDSCIQLLLAVAEDSIKEHGISNDTFK